MLHFASLLLHLLSIKKVHRLLPEETVNFCIKIASASIMGAAAKTGVPTERDTLSCINEELALP